MAIRSLLTRRPDCSVCGEAADGIEAVEEASRLRPDVVLMDISIPRMDGVQAAKIIRKEVPEAEIVLMSQDAPGIVRRQASEAGTRDSLAKTDLSRALFSILDRLVAKRSLGLTSDRNGRERGAVTQGAVEILPTTEDPKSSWESE